MRNIPIATFKDRVSEFIAAVEAGDEIVITRHGKAAARLVPIDDRDERRRRAMIAAERLKQMREKMRRERRTATIDEMIGWKNEGRK
jgi:prevent-host-death family protein